MIFFNLVQILATSKLLRIYLSKKNLVHCTYKF